MRQDPISLGVIANDEMIVRGAHDPRHGNAKTKNIKAAIVPKDDLVSGQYSVWRLGTTGIDQDELIDRLNVVPGQTLFALCAISAGALRALKINHGRAVSVVDECDCDRLGNKHPAHAHIALCQNLISAGIGKDHPEFEQLRLEIHARLKTGVIWWRQEDLAV